MSIEQQQKFLSIILEAYEKGISSTDITVEDLVDDIKKKLKVVYSETEVIAQLEK